MLATSYDLSFSTLAQFTSVCVVCNNTLQQSFKNHSGRVTIPHMRDFDENQIKHELGVGLEQWQAFTQMCESLAAIKIDTVKACRTLEKVWQIEDPDKPNPAHAHVSNVISLFQGRGIGADVRGQTGWGLVNAMTQYVDQNKRARNQGNRLDSAWFGDGFNLKQRVVDETLLLAA
jgi:phage/plasmid-like protein (TIGR03299 family)